MNLSTYKLTIGRIVNTLLNDNPVVGVTIIRKDVILLAHIIVLILF